MDSVLRLTLPMKLNSALEVTDSASAASGCGGPVGNMVAAESGPVAESPPMGSGCHADG